MFTTDKYTLADIKYSRCALTSSDKEEIMTAKVLTDKHMNFAKKFKKFTFISGLECTLKFGKRPFDKINDKHFL